MKENHCLLASVFLFSGVIYGLEPLTPFGNIRWDDNFLEVIQKVNRISGIERFVLNKGIGEIGLNNIDCKEDIRHIFRHFHRPRGKSGEFRIPYRIGFNLRNREIRVYDTYHETLKVSPLMIRQIPFEMEIRFKVSPGLPLINHRKLIRLDQRIYLSLHIDRITLRTHSSLLPEQYGGLQEAMEERYRKRREAGDISLTDPLKSNRRYTLSLATGNWESERIRTILRDEEGDEVEIMITPDYCKIVYLSVSYVNRLGAAFDNLMNRRDMERNMKSDNIADGVCSAG